MKGLGLAGRLAALAFLFGGCWVRCVSSCSLNLCLPLDEHNRHPSIHPPRPHERQRRRTRRLTQRQHLQTSRRRARRRPPQHTPSRRSLRRRRRRLCSTPRLVLLGLRPCLSRRCYHCSIQLGRCEQSTAGSPSPAWQTLSLHTSKNVSVQGLW